MKKDKLIVVEVERGDEKSKTCNGNPESVQAAMDFFRGITVVDGGPMNRFTRQMEHLFGEKK